MSLFTLKVHAQSWPLAKPFRISRGVKTTAETVIAKITDGTHSGFGECTPYPRYGESVESVLNQLQVVSANPSSFQNSKAVQSALPPGAARNALDCAMIDFTAKQSGISVAKRYGLTLKPLNTAYTLSLDEPSAMYFAAQNASSRPILKIKLGGSEGDCERLAAVRRGAPDTRLIVDANEGWNACNWDGNLKSCIHNKVDLIEQPLPANDDDGLIDLKSPIPICADESLHTREELTHISKRYKAVNVKLDKTGGLTEAIAVVNEAEASGLIIMVGCMVASSLAMAPATLIAQNASWVDLDGPLLLAQDCPNGLHFDGSNLHPPIPALWG